MKSAADQLIERRDRLIADSGALRSELLINEAKIAELDFAIDALGKTAGPAPATTGKRRNIRAEFLAMVEGSGPVGISHDEAVAALKVRDRAIEAAIEYLKGKGTIAASNGRWRSTQHTLSAPAVSPSSSTGPMGETQPPARGTEGGE